MHDILYNIYIYYISIIYLVYTISTYYIYLSLYTYVHPHPIQTVVLFNSMAERSIMAEPYWKILGQRPHEAAS